ncbi:Retinoic acid induced 16-like protein-domain-containing protein [Mortierella sp. GBAus27b]|nr:hypothetical protein BGX31_007485 [Mortierella sp. GBA43]KAI8360575.1 Retinoic acid induced 16-like protein-domain-containing protein [Mortierella sp. GBAus27b]
MESSFWNKLKKSILTPPKVQPSSALQQTRFNKCWMTVQGGFSTPEKRSLNVQQTEIPAKLRIMVDLLVYEESRMDDGTTGVCMEYLLKHNVLAKLVNNAEGDEPKGIMGETIRTIASMINHLDDRFLVHNAVHKPTLKLLRSCASGNEPQGENYHEDLVDLMYIICSKIHGYPELLNVFFHDKQWLTKPQRAKNLETMEMIKNLKASANEGSLEKDAHSQAQGGSSSTEGSSGHTASSGTASHGEPQSDSTSGVDRQSTLQHAEGPKSEYEFLLFTYLSKFVHREGKTGDFARTGLLFLMELATGSLGEYIIDADFTSFLSAGIGASYSQLPRKLLVRGGPNTINSMVGTLNDRTPPTESAPSRPNIEVSTSMDFQSKLDAFLQLLEFCQEIVIRCPNSEIVNSLLLTFKTVFLENILFPSIMECSDTDGSSVAVISYIDLILQVLKQEILVDLVLGFLMSEDEGENRIRVSQATDDAFAEVQNPQSTSSYFTAIGRFTLKDLILSRLKSRSQPTVIATLKLLNTLITNHCKYSLKLLNIHPDTKAISSQDSLRRSDSQDGGLPMIEHHVHELDLFYNLISTINPNNTAEIFCNGYESYLRDAEGSVETHQCFLRSKVVEGDKTKSGQLSAQERKQRRRSMKYGQKMDLPDELSGDAFIREQEKNTDAMAALTVSDKSASNTVPMHHLLPTDPLLQTLLGSLSHFFAHSVELNLALTGVITSLAICPCRSLEGWLLFKSSDVKKPGEDGLFGLGTDSLDDTKTEAKFELGDSEDEETMPSYLSRDNRKQEIQPISTPAEGQSDELSGASPFKSFPPFFTMLRTLTKQVDCYRSEIHGFDEYLANRRRALLVATELNSAIHTPGLANQHRSPSHPRQHHPQHQQHQQPHPSSAFGSNDLFANRPRSGSSPRFGPTGNTSSAPVHRINTTNLPSEVTQPGAAHTITSPRARKSSSPASLMSSPSNMSFMDPPVFRRPSINKSTNFSGGSGLYPGGADSDMQGHSPTTPLGAHSFRGMPGSSAPTSAGSKTASGPPQALSWQAFGPRTSSLPNHMLIRTMETTMIKPLFPDGFVNDSDSETEAEGEATARPKELSDDEGMEGSAATTVRDDDSSSSKKVDNADDGSEPRKQKQGRVRSEKKVTLGQLLTNVVILEEVVKEVVAVAQVRRGLGVDKVSFL